MKLSIVTLTGARPEAFELCSQYFSRQTIFKNSSVSTEWIVVDDGEIPSAFPIFDLQKQNVNQVILNPTPKWTPGSPNTFSRNLKLALAEVTGDVVVLCEDDDWVDETYLQWITQNHTTDNMILGENHSKYYNLHWRKSNETTYKDYAAFAQTSFSVGLIPYILWILDAHKDNFDMHFYKEAPEETFIAFHPNIHSPHVIGIKGMPGRNGIGRGHRRHSGGIWVPDTKDFKTLRSYVGNEDALAYIQIAEDYKRQESISQK